MGRKTILRQCVITRAVLPRDALWRFVRTSEGQIVFDPEGKILGRGMYVVKDPEALRELFTAKKKGLWKHVLHSEVSPETLERLAQEVSQAGSTAFPKKKRPATIRKR